VRRMGVAEAHDVADQLLAVFAGATCAAAAVAGATDGTVEGAGAAGAAGATGATGATHAHVPFTMGGDVARTGGERGAPTCLRRVCRALGAGARDARALSRRRRNVLLAYFFELRRALGPLLAKEAALGLEGAACFRCSLAEGTVFGRALVAYGEPRPALQLLRNGTLQGCEAVGDELLALGDERWRRDHRAGLAAAVFSASQCPNRVLECLLALGRVNELVDYLLQLRWLRFADVPALLRRALAAHPGRAHVALRLGLRLLGPLGDGGAAVTPEMVARGLRLFRGSGAAVGERDLGELEPLEMREVAIITTEEVIAAIQRSPYFE